MANDTVIQREAADIEAYKLDEDTQKIIHR